MTAATTPDTVYHAAPATLARASLAALAAATAILVLFVLPAEYGIDPTGAGKALGLDRMADPGDAAEPVPAPESAAEAAPAGDYAIPMQTQANIQKEAAFRADETTIELAPHTGIELKARMKTGDTFQFRWSATGPVRADMHGEPTGARDDEFTDYWKQKDIVSSQGSFTAPFAGTHGWYWKNRSDAPVTITVKMTGFYEGVFQRQ